MTARLLVLGFVALALTAVETALMAAVGFATFGLHLSLAVLLFSAIKAGDIEGVGLAALVGYGWDLFSGAPMGMSVAPAVAAFVGVRLLSQGVDVVGALQIAILGFFCTLLHGVLCLGLLAFAGSAGELAMWPAIKTILRHALAAGVLVGPVFVLVRWLDGLVVQERSEGEVWLS